MGFLHGLWLGAVESEAQPGIGGGLPFGIAELLSAGAASVVRGTESLDALGAFEFGDVFHVHPSYFAFSFHLAA
jgi:hypothetical protein